MLVCLKFDTVSLVLFQCMGHVLGSTGVKGNPGDQGFAGLPGPEGATGGKGDPGGKGIHS